MGEQMCLADFNPIIKLQLVIYIYKKSLQFYYNLIYIVEYACWNTLHIFVYVSLNIFY